MRSSDPPRTVLLLILVPMLATFAACRFYLHLVNPDSDLFIAGYNIHHLFTGAVIETVAASVLAFGIGPTWLRRSALVLLGVGSALVLDEVVYLIATDGSNAAYLTPVSLGGGVVLIAAASVLLFLLYAARRS